LKTKNKNNAKAKDMLIRKWNEKVRADSISNLDVFTSSLKLYPSLGYRIFFIFEGGLKEGKNNLISP
jgi:hypothetical protein